MADDPNFQNFSYTLHLGDGDNASPLAIGEAQEWDQPFNHTDVTSSPVPKAVEALMYVMYIVISVAAIGGNGVVCYIVLAYQRMRTVTNFFIVNLAVGDILMACLCIPFGFVSNLLLQYWPFGAVMCVVVSYAQAVSVFISAYTLVAISVDRYIAILYPLRPRMTKLQAKLIIALVWLVALLTPLPTAILSRLEQPPDWVALNLTERYTCTEAWDTNVQRYYYSMALMILQYFFPLVVLIYTYTRIAIVVWGKRTPGEAEDARDQRLAASKRKMVKMMITVVTVFTLCWLPLNTLIVVGDQDERVWRYRHIQYVWFVCHFLAMSNCSWNPVIYCWMNAKFREGFGQFCYRLCCNRHRYYKRTESGLGRCNTTTTIYTSIRSSSLWGQRGSNARGSFTKRPSSTRSGSFGVASLLEHHDEKINNLVHRVSEQKIALDSKV